MAVDKTLQEQVNKIDAVYEEYQVQLKLIKNKQSKLINEYIKELEQKKIAKLKRIINEQNYE